MDREGLERRIAELEKELAAREEDLALFRHELARTNKKLESLIHSLTREIQMAHVIQKALVPTEIPMISGFEFSTKFVSSLNMGGDYFDVFEHNDRSRFGIIVASSSSHGMSALLMSVLLKLTSQMEARRSSEPTLLVQKVAKHLMPEMNEDSQVDFFYGLFNRRNYEFSFCRAGEITVLRYDYGEEKLELLESTGGPIDIHYSDTGASKSFTFNSKDRLIICTRGVVEEKNSAGEYYGQERLFETVLHSISKDTHDLRNEILFQVQKFSGSMAPARDMSVVVVDVKDRVIRLAPKSP